MYNWAVRTFLLIIGASRLTIQDNAPILCISEAVGTALAECINRSLLSIDNTKIETMSRTMRDRDSNQLISSHAAYLTGKILRMYLIPCGNVKVPISPIYELAFMAIQS